MAKQTKTSRTSARKPAATSKSGKSAKPKAAKKPVKKSSPTPPKPAAKAKKATAKARPKATSKKRAARKASKPAAKKTSKSTAAKAKATSARKPAKANARTAAKSAKATTKSTSRTKSSKKATPSKRRPAKPDLDVKMPTEGAVARDVKAKSVSAGPGLSFLAGKPGSSGANDDVIAERPRLAKSKLNARDLAKFRDLLLQKRRQLLGDMEGMEKEALQGEGSNLSHLPLHMADQGTDNYEQEFTLNLIHRDRKIIEEIDHALAKIDNKTYGICEGTGQMISKTRLEAQPWVRDSIEHARRNARNGAARNR